VNAHIDNLPKIAELAAAHDFARTRLAEVRSGAEVELRVMADEAPVEVGHVIRMTCKQGEDVLLQMLASIRAELGRFGMSTPDPPAIFHAVEAAA
jgi:hypothetical protein